MRAPRECAAAAVLRVVRVAVPGDPGCDGGATRGGGAACGRDVRARTAGCASRLRGAGSIGAVVLRPPGAGTLRGARAWREAVRRAVPRDSWVSLRPRSRVRRGRARGRGAPGVRVVRGKRLRSAPPRRDLAHYRGPPLRGVHIPGRRSPRREAVRVTAALCGPQHGHRQRLGLHGLDRAAARPPRLDDGPVG